MDERIGSMEEVGAELLRLAAFLLGGSSKVGFPHQEAKHRGHNLEDHKPILHCKHRNVNSLAAFPLVMLNFSHTSGGKFFLFAREIRGPRDPPGFGYVTLNFRCLSRRRHILGVNLQRSVYREPEFFLLGRGDVFTIGSAPRGERTPPR